jgi:GNAT superfamily N-acetyltransferase
MIAKYLPGGVMAQNKAAASAASAVTIAPLAGKDLDEAARIVRVAFGTFLGAPDPENFWTDRDYAHGRHPGPHVASWGAFTDGRLVGINFATRWGSVGFFGPLSVLPELHERGIARALLARTVEQFDAWGTRHAGLCTFPHSAKHIALYQKYGFSARFLTAIMSGPARSAPAGLAWSRFGALGAAQQDAAFRGCRTLTDGIYAGLDLSDEIRMVQKLKLGDTVLVDGDNGIAAFAICHHGPRSEAGDGMCFVKFGAVRAGPAAARDFIRLIEATEALAADIGMPNVLAGVNMARHEAYRALVERGYRTEIQPVAMHRDNDPGYCRPGVYVIDDWR